MFRLIWRFLSLLISCTIIFQFIFDIYLILPLEKCKLMYLCTQFVIVIRGYIIKIKMHLITKSESTISCLIICLGNEFLTWTCWYNKAIKAHFETSLVLKVLSEIKIQQIRLLKCQTSDCVPDPLTPSFCEIMKVKF